ncbi:MAG TPA: flagellar motor switch protein FliM [Ruminococcaceae bacterium]|nr:flagellar motor switch protein FliM [Oscillospiraceae bacterium]
MAEVLSQQQIDELLGNLQSGNTDITEIEENFSAKKVKDYDFMSPKKFTREQLHLLQNIFENFARLFSLHLSSMLRMPCQAEILQVEEEEYKEFGNALTDSVLVSVMSMNSLSNKIEDKKMLVEVSRPISFSILDRLLGGDGSGYNIDRDYTEIEISILDYFFKQIANILNEAWNNYIDLTHNMDSIETNSQLIQFVQQDESVAIIVVEITLNELKGNMNICLPAASLEKIFKVFDSKYIRVDKKTDPEEIEKNRQHILEALKDTPLTVSAKLGNAEITLKDLLDLSYGDVIPLNSPVGGDSIILSVEKLNWFSGKIGIKKKNYAVKIGKVLH